MVFGSIKIVAIIPARGGSKRIPQKNIYLLGGKPLIAYTIEHAKQSKFISRVIVSTDDENVRKVSKEYGAEIIDRPKDLATDIATSESVLLHVLEWLEKGEKYSPDLVVFLQCTSPLRKKDDIDNAITTLINKGGDSLFSAFRFTKYVWALDGEDVLSINFDYKRPRWREQDFPPQFQENGSIYVIKPWVLKELNSRFGGKVVIHEMDYLDSFQIDSYEDIELCEYLLKRRQRV